MLHQDVFVIRVEVVMQSEVVIKHNCNIKKATENLSVVKAGSYSVVSLEQNSLF